MPKEGGIPRSVSSSYAPTAISGSSLPLGGSSLNSNVGAWLDAISWLRNNVKSTDVVVMWWDYGNWLSDLGNVTSLADNTTVNSTQIENVGFTFMGNENQSMAMLSSYGQSHIKYIAVFVTLGVVSSSSSSTSSTSLVAYPYGFGDEGKWVWMARISGQGSQRLIDSGYISATDMWTNESSFGSSGSNNQWQWNDRGLNCTVEELMSYAESAYASHITNLGQYSITPDHTATTPTYFQLVELAGQDASPQQYGGLIPLVAIYKVDWASYDADRGITPPS